MLSHYRRWRLFPGGKRENDGDIKSPSSSARRAAQAFNTAHREFDSPPAAAG